MRVAASQPRENHRLKSNASGCEAAIQIILGVPIFILWYEANPCWAPWFRYMGVGASGVTSPPPPHTQKILSNWTGVPGKVRRYTDWLPPTIRTFFGLRSLSYWVANTKFRGGDHKGGPPDPHSQVFWTLRSSNMYGKIQTSQLLFFYRHISDKIFFLVKYRPLQLTG